MPRISIIIPTLNEEQLLPKLLESIKKQTFTDYEVIVADAGSSDNTVTIAKEYGAVVVPGGLPGVGRNRGAEASKGEFLFFLDADVILPEDFLEKALNEMEEQFVDLATCEFRPLSDLRMDRILFQLSNLFVRINQKFNPRAAGFCIFISSRLFRRIGGFDESIRLAEDHDLVERASKFRPLYFLKSTYIYVSIRRLEKEGRFSLIEKYLLVELHLLTKGKIKDSSPIEYEFANFQKKINPEDKTLLNELEKIIIDLETKYNQWESGIGIKNPNDQWLDYLQKITNQITGLLQGKESKK